MDLQYLFKVEHLDAELPAQYDLGDSVFLELLPPRLWILGELPYLLWAYVPSND